MQTEQTTTEIELNKKYLVQIEDRLWIVQKIADAEYTVGYTDKDKQAKIVQTHNHPTGQNCTGTYYDYNQTCPHIEAVEKLRESKKLDTMSVDYDMYRKHDEVDTLVYELLESGESRN